MDIWEWTYDWADAAHEKEDAARIKIFEDLHAGMRLMHSDPNRAVANLALNAESARRLQEPWMALLNEHWRLQALLNYSRDYNSALDVAVRAAVEARKPACAGLPQRVCLHEDLISSYVGIDAHGHAKLIQDALDYMEREVDPGAECRYCLYGLNREFALELGDETKAARFAFQELAALSEHGDHRDHHGSSVLSDLCRIALSIYQEPDTENGEKLDEDAVRLGQIENLQHWARIGEAMAERSHHEMLLPGLVMWQAVAQRIFTVGLEKEMEAGDIAHDELYKRARNLARSLPTKPTDSYYAAWRTYHDNFGEWEAALEAADVMLKDIEGCGRKAREARCHTYRCYVLMNLGRLTHEDIEVARTVALRLVEPQRYLTPLDQFAELLESETETA